MTTPVRTEKGVELVSRTIAIDGMGYAFKHGYIVFTFFDGEQRVCVEMTPERIDELADELRNAAIRVRRMAQVAASTDGDTPTPRAAA